jgi:hypothetical protein
MKHVTHFSFQKRVADKAAARAKDEQDLRSGVVSAAQLARINGGGLLQKVQHAGPSLRIQRLASAS